MAQRSDSTAVELGEQETVAGGSGALQRKPQEPVIQKNGEEYLVLINGNVFVALSLSEAEAMVKRRRPPMAP